MKKLLFISLIIFSLLFTLGIYLSSQKQLWRDEIYTELNIEKKSFLEIAKGDMVEGNLSPIFYLVQKTLISALNFHFPLQWRYEFCIHEPYSQILLRIPTILYFSMAITLIFFTFSRHYSYKIGIFAFALTLSHPMIWQYWAEARPYGLWLSLSILQACLLLNFLHKPQKNPWIIFGICHILLALTFVFSVIQILLVSIILLVLSKKDRIKVFLTLLICFGIIYYYSSLVKKFYGFTPSNTLGTAFLTLQHSYLECFMLIKKWFLPLLNLCLPWSYFIPLGLYLSFVMTKLNFKRSLLLKESIVFLICILALIICSIALLFMFSVWKIAGLANYGAPDRYFFFLVPYGIFAVVLSSLNLYKTYSDKTIRLIVISVSLGTLLLTALNTLITTIKMGFY